MKKHHFIYFLIAIFGIVFPNMIEWKYPKGSLTSQERFNRNREIGEPPINDVQPKSLEGGEKLKDDIETVMMERTVDPPEIKLREPKLNNVASLTVLRNAVLRGRNVLWSSNQEEITSVQQSPDGTMVLFYNCDTNEYEIYRIDTEILQRLDFQLPHQDQTTRVDRWYWMGNEKLIGEHSVLFDPAPQGYEDEGWTKDKILYIFDLKKKNHYRVRLNKPAKFESNRHKTIENSFDPSHNYVIPIARYYSIKGITEEGSICLASFDTNAPKGANIKDEGYFVLTEGQ